MKQTPTAEALSLGCAPPIQLLEQRARDSCECHSERLSFKWFKRKTRKRREERSAVAWAPAALPSSFDGIRCSFLRSKGWGWSELHWSILSKWCMVRVSRRCSLQWLRVSTHVHGGLEAGVSPSLLEPSRNLAGRDFGGMAVGRGVRRAWAFVLDLPHICSSRSSDHTLTGLITVPT